MKKFFGLLFFIPFAIVCAIAAATFAAGAKDRSLPTFLRTNVQDIATALLPKAPPREKIITVHVPFNDSPEPTPLKEAFNAAVVRPTINDPSASPPPPMPEIAAPTEMPASQPAVTRPEIADTDVVTINPSIRMTGQTVKGGRDTVTTWATTWGSYQKEGSTRRFLSINLSTTARTSQQAKVEVWFLWRNQATNKLDIESIGTKTVTIRSGWPESLLVEAAAEDTDDKYNALGIQEKTGQRFIAWIARATDANNKTVASAASSSSYLRYLP